MDKELPDDIENAVSEFQAALAAAVRTLERIEAKDLNNDKKRMLIRIEADKIRTEMWKITGVTLNE